MLNAKHVRRINYRKKKKNIYKIIPAKHKRELFCYNVSYGTKKDVL